MRDEIIRLYKPKIHGINLVEIADNKLAKVLITRYGCCVLFPDGDTTSHIPISLAEEVTRNFNLSVWHQEIKYSMKEIRAARLHCLKALKQSGE